MTNETTASQPKSIENERVAFEKWAISDDGGWIESALKRNPEGNEFCYTDDDVQAEWRAWSARALLDSRAPAAQASATIQAASEGYVSVKKSLLKGVHSMLIDSQWLTAADELSDAIDAATIQEPVMVAAHDINDDGHFATLLGTGMHPLTQKCIIDFVNSWGNNLAAPMVADPAGVAVDHDEAVTLLSAVFDAWENGDDCHEDGDPSATYMGKAFKLDDEIFDRCCALINRLNPPRNISAATVKAVPSEALSRRVGVPDNMIQWAVRELLGALPERRDWFNPEAEAVLRAEFQRAAPLADKTGGGE